MKTATLGDMTWGKEEAFMCHRMCPWTVRYVGTLGGVTQSSLRPGQQGNGFHWF